MTEPSHLFDGVFAPGRRPDPRPAIALTPIPTIGHGSILYEGTGREGIGAQVEGLAEALLRRGVQPGDRIAWIGPNDPWQIALLAACSRLGAIHLPLNWRLSVEELRWIEADAGFRLLAVPDGVARFPGQRFRHPYVEDFQQRRGGEPGVFCGDPGSWRLPSPPDGAWPELGALPPPPPEAPLLLCYSSGTTGRPKGVLLSQAAMAAHARMAIGLFGLGPADCVLTVLPLFHVGGLCIQTLPALIAGADAVLQARFDADAFFDSLATDRPTLTLLVPAIMRALVAHPHWATADLSSLRAIGAGASEVPLDLIEAFHARGIPVQQVYGATETGPIAIAQSLAEARAAPGSIGRPIAPCEARIRRPDGSPAAPGEAGEIELRGPNLFTGYWGQSEATRAAFTADGWFRTGDVGRCDAAGRYWFTDRLKHLIISGGENIYPAEVERVLREAPGVAEGAVCGRPDARWGEVPVAVVVPGEGFSPEAVLCHFEGRLARFKHPRAVVAVEALPRTALGKVRLEEIREMARG